MKNKVIFQLILYLLFSHYLLAETNKSFSLKNSIVKYLFYIVDNQLQKCGTGFAVDGLGIVTVLHNIPASCRENGFFCKDLKVFFLNDELKGNFKVFIHPFLDLAYLKPQNMVAPFLSFFKLKTTNASVPKRLFFASFPQCKDINLRSGTVSSFSPLYLQSNIRGYYGSSGGVLFLKDGSVVGIADRVLNMQESIPALLYSKPFQMRFIKAEFLRYFINNQEINNNLQALFYHFMQYVANLKGIERIRYGIEFYQMFNRLKQSNLTTLPSYNYLRVIYYFETSRYNKKDLQRIIASFPSSSYKDNLLNLIKSKTSLASVILTYLGLFLVVVAIFVIMLFILIFKVVKRKRYASNRRNS